MATLISEKVIYNEPTLLLKSFENQPDFYTTKLGVKEAQVALMFANILRHWVKGINYAKQGILSTQMTPEELEIYKAKSALLPKREYSGYVDKMPHYSQQEIDLCAAKQNFRLYSEKLRHYKEQHKIHQEIIAILETELLGCNNVEREVEIIKDQIIYMEVSKEYAELIDRTQPYVYHYQSEIERLKGRI